MKDEFNVSCKATFNCWSKENQNNSIEIIISTLKNLKAQSMTFIT